MHTWRAGWHWQYPSRREGYGPFDAPVIGHCHQAQSQARNANCCAHCPPFLAFRHWWLLGDTAPCAVRRRRYGSNQRTPAKARTRAVLRAVSAAAAQRIVGGFTVPAASSIVRFHHVCRYHRHGDNRRHPRFRPDSSSHHPRFGLNYASRRKQRRPETAAITPRSPRIVVRVQRRRKTRG
jgi:hypothetical protein